MSDRIIVASASSSASGGPVVPGAARLAGAVASAVVVVDGSEHDRRSACGLGAVTSLPLLDALMCMPYGIGVRAADVGDSVAAAVRSAPEWLQWDGPVVRRVVVPAAEVALVVVESARWADALGRAAVFSSVAPRGVLLDRAAIRDSRLWEADAAGIGVWARDADGTVDKLVAPGPFVQRYFKPAGWRFRERAYGAWLTSTRP